MYIARCLFRASKRPHKFPVKSDWLTFIAWHKITSQLTDIKATKEGQATREVNVWGDFLSFFLCSQKKLQFVCLFFKLSLCLSRLSSPFIISNWVEKISVRFLNWKCLGTIGLIVANWKFDELKTSIFALVASLRSFALVASHQISAEQLLLPFPSD